MSFFIYMIYISVMDFAFTLPDRQVRYSHGVLTFDNNDNVSELSPPVGRFINLNHKKHN